MDQDLITSLVEEMGVNENLAQMAVTEAQGELEKAREILEGLLPKYLFIKCRYLSVRSSGSGGLVFIIAEKGAKEFLMFRTVVESDRDWVNGVSVNTSPDGFYQIIRKYFDDHTSSLRLFDSQKLKDHLEENLNQSSMQYLFTLWNVPKTELLEDENPVSTFDNPGALIHQQISDILSNVLVDRFEMVIDYDFLTEVQFDQIAVSLGLKKAESEESGEESGETKKDDIKVYMKGQFLIDAVGGELVSNLDVGDKVFCEILDRTEVAVSVSRLIGAYKKGLWLPIRGTIQEVKRVTGDRSRFRLRVAKSIYVDVMSFNDVKIRVSNITNKQRIMAMQNRNHSSTSPLPLLIAVVLLVMLIMVFMTLQ